MTDTLLTIGLPVHNAMPYLPEAMESILAQTAQNFEIIAIVDGGSDGSLDYLHSIRDERLRILSQPNYGLVYTLNRMLRECQTPWLVRHDADDLSTLRRLEAITHAIEQNPDAGMFYSDAAYHPIGKSIGLFRSTRGTPEQIRSLTRSGYIPAICHPSAVLHVERTLAIGGYRGGLHCEDADLWWRMALAHDIQFIPEVLLHFRQNPGSLTSKNLRNQALHGLYVQYLLLSQLQNRLPAALHEVEDTLTRLLASEPLRAKELLRLFNMQLSQGQWCRALLSFGASVKASPSYVLRRLRDEFTSSSILGNGLPPQLFQQQAATLWPEYSIA